MPDLPNPALSAMPQTAERLTSLDALRGFTMMWIVGADAVGRALANMQGGSWLKTIATQLSHAPWAGLHFYDLIMPLFLFMVGAAVPYSLDKALAQDGGTRAALWRVMRRTLLLYVIGLFFYGGFSAHGGELRYCGVLQRIAFCYCAASLIYLCRPSARTLGIACGAILLGYWVLMAFVPVPGFGAGDFAEGHNLANWFDARFLPGFKWDGDHDPEGVLGTLCAVSTTLMGVLAGKWLRREEVSPGKKAAVLAGWGAALLAAGLVWAAAFPIIKKIWTSSYALAAGGCSLLLLALFYWVIDACRRRAWATPLVWMGTNAIAIFLLGNVMSFSSLTKRLIGGPVAGMLDGWCPGLARLCVALGSVALCFLVCRFLYKRKIFLRL